MLRFDRIRAHNVGPFRDVDVNLAALPAIVAVVGPNGAGKSTLLELLGGALTRECPTRGALAGLARERDSWVEVDVVNGAPWRVRQSMDAISGKGEALVLDGAGAAVLTSTKVREFDTWAAAHFPAPSVLYSSTFGVQGSAGFLALKPSDRKAVLLRVLGIERFERMAAKAREELSIARGRHATASALAGAVVGLAIAETEERLQRAIAADGDASRALEAAHAALSQLRLVADERAEIVREARARSVRREAVATRIDVLDATIREAEQRIANNRGLVEKRAEIEGAVARVAALREERTRIESSLYEARTKVDQLDERIARACASDLEAFDYQEQQCEIRERPARPIAARRAVVDEAVAGLDAARKRAADNAAAVEAERLALDAMLSQTVAGAEDRIVGLRGGLTKLLGPFGIASEIAQTTLDADDEAQRFAAQVPTFTATCREKLAAAQAKATASDRDLRACERLAGQAVEVQVAEDTLTQCAAERKHVAEGRAKLSRDTAEMRAAREVARTGVSDLKVAQARVSAELARIEPIAARAEHLAKATARIEELEAGLVYTRAERAGHEAQLVEMGTDDGAIPPEVDVAGAERALREAQSGYHRAASALDMANRDHTEALARDTRRAELERDRDAIAEQISDWKRLADDLGRDGIQALEIDAAGPELSALANDLLHTCVGPRWTVTIDTQRTSSDGRLLESLDVRVLDTVAGRDANVETYSGGERVLLGEAVSLALAMLACRRSGQRDVTIVRDESGAALDGERGRAYVAMLRRALTLTGARQVLLVSHSEDVASLCDAQLHVENGKVEVR